MVTVSSLLGGSGAVRIRRPYYPFIRIRSLERIIEKHNILNSYLRIFTIALFENIEK